MRRALLAVAVAIVVDIGAGFSPGLEAHADSTVGTVVSGLTLDTTSESLHGTEAAELTVTARLENPNGVGASTGPMGVPCPCVWLAPVDDSGSEVSSTGYAFDQRIVALHLVSGDDHVGVWAGNAAIGAANQGHWAVTRTFTGDAADWTPIDGVAQGADVVVAGTDWPESTISWASVPFGTAYTLRGHVSLVSSGRPVAGATVSIGGNEYFQTHVIDVHTDANGDWRYSSTKPIQPPVVLIDAKPVVAGSVYQYSSSWYGAFVPPVRFVAHLAAPGGRSLVLTYRPASYRGNAQLMHVTSTGLRYVQGLSLSSSGRLTFRAPWSGKYFVTLSSRDFVLAMTNSNTVSVR